MNIKRNAMLAGVVLALAVGALAQSVATDPAPATRAKAGKAAPVKATDPAAEVRSPEEVRKLMEAKFPGADIRHVGKAPVLGLFEVMLDGQLVYTDPKVSVVFVGNLFDADRRVNLTQDRMQELSAVSWSDLPLELAIKEVKGTGARKLAIFSDVDCPFCKRLEAELKEVSDVTIYTFLFPIDSLHPDARRKSKLVWCASDRKKAYDDLMSSGTQPASSADCDDPVAKIVALGEKFRIQATPTMIFADGRVVPGALPKARIEEHFTRVAAGAKKKDK